MNETRKLNPCVGRCTTAAGGDVCRGCGRTVEEIRDWNQYDTATKLAVLERLKTRDAE